MTAFLVLVKEHEEAREQGGGADGGTGPFLSREAGGNGREEATKAVEAKYVGRKRTVRVLAAGIDKY